MPQIKEPIEPGTPYVVIAGWEHSPHITEAMKVEFRKTIPPNMIPAREHGIPYLGAGAIYPIPLDQIIEDPFPIPDFWPRVYALDVGWKRTAALWVAIDRDSDIMHAYSEHYAGKAEPIVHAQAIMGNGTGNLRAKWIPGLIDPAARQRSQKEGTRLVQSYRDAGLDLELGQTAVEAGIAEVWQRLSTGRLKIFKHLTNFAKEYVLYRRNEQGQIIKKNDHLCDCLKILVLSGLRRAKAVPVAPSMPQMQWNYGESGQGWMAG